MNAPEYLGSSSLGSQLGFRVSVDRVDFDPKELGMPLFDQVEAGMRMVQTRLLEERLKLQAFLGNVFYMVGSTTVERVLKPGVKILFKVADVGATVMAGMDGQSVHRHIPNYVDLMESSYQWKSLNIEHQIRKNVRASSQIRENHPPGRRLPGSIGK